MRFGALASLDLATEAGTAISNFDQHSRGIFNHFFDIAQKHDRFAAIHEPVVIRQRKKHHRADDDLSVQRDRAFLDRVHSQNARLRRIDDGRREQRTENAAVRDGERAALKFFRLQFSLLRTFRKIGDGFFNFRKNSCVQRSAKPDDQPAVARNCHANIKTVMINDVVAANFGVELRKLFQRADDGFHEKRHEAELDLITLFKRFLIFFFATSARRSCPLR